MTCNSCSTDIDCGYSDYGNQCKSNKLDWNVYQDKKSVITIRVKGYDLIADNATLSIDFVKAIGDTPTLTLSSLVSSEISMSNNLVNGEVPTGETVYTDISLYLTVEQVNLLGSVSNIMIGDLIINCDIDIPPIRYNVKYSKTT